MRVRTPLLLGALCALLFPLNACTSEARAEVRAAEVTARLAPGDSILVVGRWTVLGTPDSVRLTVSGTRAATRVVWFGAASNMGQAVLAPAPVLADGETATGQACVAVAFAGKVSADRCKPWSVTRPGAAMDSVVVQLTFVPDSLTVQMGDTVRFSLWARYQSGRTSFFMGDYWTNTEAGIHLVTARLGGRTATARIRVLASPYEPAAFVPFASHPLDAIPPFPRGPAPGPCPGASWCGRWL